MWSYKCNVNSNIAYEFAIIDKKFNKDCHIVYAQRHNGLDDYGDDVVYYKVVTVDNSGNSYTFYKDLVPVLSDWY